ncbi:ABC transporter substrate-binding protein [Longirhabdus pacifica]|uniref:ABC transporter substrate-binding protein n=1 Tax=Longirhabdus pacifica TaxID=2305227 RepID=UPI00100918BF|nr:ABC transporter substrate-binding protein [Longirhabdus pacifica]
MNWKKVSLFVFMLMLLFSLVVGCGTTEDNGEQDTTESATDAFPLTIVDGVGEEVTIDKAPERIVTGIASNTEIAFALGLDEHIVGVDNFSNYPEQALNKEKIGDMYLSAELILAQEPDLILLDESHQNNSGEIVQLLKDADLDVMFIQSASTFDEVYENISLIAKATDTVETGENIIQDMKDRHDVLKEKAKEMTQAKKVWVEVSPAPDIYTTGKGTFMDEMLTSIGATNVAGDQEGWVMLNEEEIVTLQPEVIITTYGYYVENAKEQILAREGWSEVPAIQNEQVFDVHGDIVTRPGPRLIDGVEELAKVIYPEIFAE